MLVVATIRAARIAAITNEKPMANHGPDRSRGYNSRRPGEPGADSLTATCRWAARLVTILALLASQVPTSEGGPDIEKSLLDLSEALPVEYRAGIYFRLAEAGKGPRGRERTAALEALFIAAAQARQKLPVVRVASIPASRDQYVAAASRLRLDELSIRCRVVREIGKTDVKRARELFRQLYHDLAPPSGGCGPWLVFDPGPHGKQHRQRRRYVVIW